MYIIEEENIDIVPVDFNVFYNMAKEYKKNIRFSREYTISESFFNELCYYISDSSNEIIALDMENIVSYPTRMFSRLEKCLKKIVFYNIENVKVKQMLTEDLEELVWIDDTIAYYFDNDGQNISKMVINSCEKTREKEVKRIVSSIVRSEEGKGQLLESSGLYSNCYVDIKKLFFNVDNYYYIVYSLAKVISDKTLNMQIDAFVSASKNGAILANILGGLLDIKEVHLIGVGPKYSMELGDSVECLKQGKRYAYIFDFMCTGTELKIVSALINSKKAYLPYAAGIAKYKKEMNSCNIESMDILVDTDDLNIEYKIVGEKEDLKLVMR